MRDNTKVRYYRVKACSWMMCLSAIFECNWEGESFRIIDEAYIAASQLKSQLLGDYISVKKGLYLIHCTLNLIKFTGRIWKIIEMNIAKTLICKLIFSIFNISFVSYLLYINVRRCARSLNIKALHAVIKINWENSCHGLVATTLRQDCSHKW